MISKVLQTEKSAGAVVFRQQGGKIEYLLLHYGAGHWDFPKGHIEEGEEEIETVRRETEEETGIRNIEIIPGFQERISYFYRKPKNWFLGRLGKIVANRSDVPQEGAFFKTAVFYLARAAKDEVKLSHEHIGYKWLSYQDALRQLTFQNAKDILQKANNFLTRIVTNKSYK